MLWKRISSLPVAFASTTGIALVQSAGAESGAGANAPGQGGYAAPGGKAGPGISNPSAISGSGVTSATGTDQGAGAPGGAVSGRSDIIMQCPPPSGSQPGPINGIGR